MLMFHTQSHRIIYASPQPKRTKNRQREILFFSEENTRTDPADITTERHQQRKRRTQTRKLKIVYCNAQGI